MHHSRDTDRKQWNETNALAMQVPYTTLKHTLPMRSLHRMTWCLYALQVVHKYHNTTDCTHACTVHCYHNVDVFAVLAYPHMLLDYHC
jgi:hypothetical protein